ncbi:MAG: polyphosphate kinase 1 [Candidatus Fimadaptatus sp.]
MEATQNRKANETMWPKEDFFNRELSWLEFNQRVLDQARAESEDAARRHPVFERMKFLSITSSNLDEFFMVRVASLNDQYQAGYNRPDPSGLTPRMQLDAISRRAHDMVSDMYRVFRQQILPELRKSGIRLLADGQLTDGQRAYLDDYFEQQVYPVLTPMAVDSSRPFPLILSKSLNLGVLLEDEEYPDEPSFATVQVPSVLDRVVYLPRGEGDEGVMAMLLEQVISRNVARLFPGRKVICCYPYRVTRNADMTIDEEGAEDLLQEIEKSLKQRRWGAVIRLEIDHRADKRLLDTLTDALEVDPGFVFSIHGPLNLDFLMKSLYKLDYPQLKYAPYSPRRLDRAQALKPSSGFTPIEPGAAAAHTEPATMFDRIAAGDVLLFHPYDSFEPVIDFIREAARDPNVLAIKQTLYRVSGDSPIVAALMEAAENGKQVTALLEVKARFDEENNIHWGKRLEQAGAHVIYGLVGLKTHSKITLIVRREGGRIRRYVHLGTGNYNDVTANIYTDHGLMTCRPDIGEDASAFFNMLTGYSEQTSLKKLIAAPHMLRDRMTALIRRETEAARAGQRAGIFMKMNSLVDERIIAALYEASCAGVRVRLIVRGICCLVPGVPGVSDNICVRSIVGRYLEHSRAFIFRNGGDEEVYLASADMMPRNLNRRVELMFPVEDPVLRLRIKKLMRAQWRDNVQARELAPDGRYYPVSGGKSPFSSQDFCMESDEV